MNNIGNVAGLSTADLLKNNSANTKTQSDGNAFAEQLKNALNDVNEMQEESEKAIADLATGEVKDLHQAALAIGKAETSMKLMLEIRNKALNAYKEIGRTQL